MPHQTPIPIGGCVKPPAGHFAVHIVVGTRDEQAPLGFRIKHGHMLIKCARPFRGDEQENIARICQNIVRRAGLDPEKWHVLSAHLERLTSAGYHHRAQCFRTRTVRQHRIAGGRYAIVD